MSLEKTRQSFPVPADAKPADSPHQDALVVIHTGDPTLLGRRLVLEQSPFRMGRDSDCDLSLEDTQVSRVHAEIQLRTSGWTVSDRGSTNGTYVNDERVRDERLLLSGDQIRIGGTILKYLHGSDAEVDYHEALYKLSVLDPLTEIYNKRYLCGVLEREHSRACRQKLNLSVLIIDVDRFKRINDRYGHTAGDSVLRQIAGIVKQRVRHHDIPARYGGEEFVAVLPGTPLDGARTLAENLRAAIEQGSFIVRGVRIPVTVSIGCASLERGDLSPVDLLHRADQQLYAAKEAGRNRVAG